MSKYDNNLIISLLPTDAERLKKWCLQKGIPTDIIFIEFSATGKMQALSDGDKHKISQLTSKSRLYINGHGVAGTPFAIANDNKKRITVYDLADILADNLNKKNTSGLRISLNVCRAAKKYKINTNDMNQDIAVYESFASILHRTLGLSGIKDIDLVAHTSNVGNYLDTRSNTIYKFVSNEANKECITRMHRIRTRALQSTSVSSESISSSVKKYNLLSQKIIISTMDKIKSRKYMLFNEKIQFHWEDENQVELDVYKLKNLEKEATDLLRTVNLATEAKQFCQKKTYLDKISFLQSVKTKITNESTIKIVNGISEAMVKCKI